ncbi:hypothetical protein FLT15_12010 [Paenibacillus thiaminolyticus]|uniref:hypothetical protein n=1 Tax=Paenibacillus thiaminolyticus TaxID=49283 RepID=UPI0011647758|nr:hypothetical protein [Paenibacillus thiaminolyticus]NGP59055.1 hypothetical protein [Paenibacillus thiaminolyticus]
MAEGKLRENLTLLIATLGLFISLVVMLFGDNFFGRTGETKLSIVTSQNEFQLPDKLNGIILRSISSNELELIPDTIRISNLKNSGATSKNLKVVLNLDGPIYQHKILSTEEVEVQIVDGTNVKLNMERLSKNAEISMIFWIRNENKNFSAHYADDNKSGTVEVNSTQNTDDTKVNNIFLLLSLISIGVIIYQLIVKMVSKVKNASLDSNKELINEMMDFYLYLNNRNGSEFTEYNDDESSAEEDPKEKLSKMMEKIKQANLSK